MSDCPPKSSLPCSQGTRDVGMSSVNYIHSLQILSIPSTPHIYTVSFTFQQKMTYGGNRSLCRPIQSLLSATATTPAPDVYSGPIYRSFYSVQCLLVRGYPSINLLLTFRSFVGIVSTSMLRPSSEELPSGHTKFIVTSLTSEPSFDSIWWELWAHLRWKEPLTLFLRLSVFGFSASFAPLNAVVPLQLTI